MSVCVVGELHNYMKIKNVYLSKCVNEMSERVYELSGGGAQEHKITR